MRREKRKKGVLMLRISWRGKGKKLARRRENALLFQPGRTAVPEEEDVGERQCRHLLSEKGLDADPSFQIHGDVERGSRVSDKVSVISCSKEETEHARGKVPGHRTILRSSAVNIKKKGCSVPGKERTG